MYSLAMMNQTDIHPHQLAEVVEAFLARTGMSESAFGLKAVRDHKLVPQLRAGREPRMKTVARVIQFMSEHRDAA